MNTSTNRRAQYASDEERWQAILQKDRNADGNFFFSVETTGVYCRPSCPARPARRENVAFHELVEDAERAASGLASAASRGDRHSPGKTRQS
jgi:AraC family transcriptional regulator, regulatory protein of adaptative response / methylated-DNA-[protein]-cysteine methyltransferase